MKKKIWIGIGMLLAAAIVVFFTLRQNSLSLTCKANGYRISEVIDSGQSFYPDSQEPYLIAQAYSADGDIALIRAEKDALGFWHIADIQPVREDNGYASIIWLKRAGWQSFKGDEKLEREWHFAYCGDNAVAKIEIRPDQLPSNCAVDIQQFNESYLIHIICFSDEGPSIDMRELLLKNGFISPE